MPLDQVNFNPWLSHCENSHRLEMLEFPPETSLEAVAVRDRSAELMSTRSRDCPRKTQSEIACSKSWRCDEPDN